LKKGCTDKYALNYSNTAKYNDGFCVYSDILTNCPAPDDLTSLT